MKMIIFYNDGTIKVSEAATELSEDEDKLWLTDADHNFSNRDDGTLTRRDEPLQLLNVAKIEVIP